MPFCGRRLNVRTIKNDHFYKRVYFILGVILLSFFLLILRLYYLQVHQKDHYKMLSDKNRIHLTPLKPTRGRIFDRQGRILADNKKNYHAILDQRKIKNLEEVLQNISVLISLSEEEQHAILEQAQEIPSYILLDLKRNLSWKDVSTLQIHNLTLPGVDVIETEERSYPFGEVASHIIGYVGKPDKKAVQENALLSLPGMVEGKNGLEKYYNTLLTGLFGQLETENNARGHQVRILSRYPSQKGKDLKLTIDIELQKFIHTQLKAHKSATAIVMDAETGAIYAMVSVPTYDPNMFTNGISYSDWSGLVSAEGNPLVNKAVLGLYSPGSLIKVFLSTALLENSEIDPSDPVFCTGKYPMGKHTFHCWKKSGHGNLSLSRALIESCDVFFYKIAQLIGIQKLLSALKMFNFDQQTGIDLPQEKRGLIPSPIWKKRTGQGSWYPGDTINLSIGQGALLSTPLQWAQAMAIIANGGKSVRPHLYFDEEPHVMPLEIENKEALNFIKKTLEKIVNSPNGTGRHAKLNIPEFQIAGKTSTSQVRRISLSERESGIRSVSDTPWHLRDNAMFVGYAPAHKPKYVLALMIEHGGWGGRTTGPIVKKIFKYIYKNRHRYDSQ
jgi:penicillin-binding protein 2